LGRATGRLLAAAGARVVVLDRHSDRPQAVAEEVTHSGGTASVICADPVTPASADVALKEAESKAAGLDILVNINGTLPMGQRRRDLSALCGGPTSRFPYELR
jgi:NAD(P)-dependent dehydrogenase (short-subunit alcohol dehydrogenase family)